MKQVQLIHWEDKEMKIEVKIMPREEFDENGIGWSHGVEIDEFILHPSDIEFEWDDGSTLPYNDFVFFGEDYYYGIFVDGVNINEYQNKLGIALELIDNLDYMNLIQDEENFSLLLKLRGDYNEE